MAGDHGGVTSRFAPYLLVGLPAVFLLIFFVIPTALLFSASVLQSDGMTPTGGLTLDNFGTLLTHRIYIDAILRSFEIGIAVGALVVLLAYPIAYLLVRTETRWKNLLLALALSPLLASVIVRTYGWWVLFNRDGAINSMLLGLGVISKPLLMLPSTPVIVIGLTHALMPYGILTLMASLQGISPNVERAASSLGASRMRRFLEVTLPLTMPGIVGGFLLAFGVAISAYATPAILGGPASQTMATLIFTLMMTLLDWSLGSALGVVLLATTFGVLALTALASRRRAIA
jgi:putative spermidine/putrescine transport system permease protein